ncbi:Uncharacterised protein [Yersinia enterocolitica]|nr:Uncharacterised protein [Yersinia enterocolitica]CNK87858.1 Uncharacterised protein [Yersinia enterocolitica]CQH09038.1 Uncharacterised protein [Yersinia enterocolitica]CQH15810.1 Uncharacterised protein [Yersinia enterocolitica]CRX53627.1 Uncharacterised protein [Yersinia enterocolitica]
MDFIDVFDFAVNLWTQDGVEKSIENSSPD